MAHHGNDERIAAELAKLIEEFERREMKLGPTGDFPEGKLCPDDEGGVQFAIGSEGGKVILNFGERPITWVGMDPQQAADLASSLIRHARDIGKKTGVTVSIGI